MGGFWKSFKPLLALILVISFLIWILINLFSGQLLFEAFIPTLITTGSFLLFLDDYLSGRRRRKRVPPKLEEPKYNRDLLLSGVHGFFIVAMLWIPNYATWYIYSVSLEVINLHPVFLLSFIFATIFAILGLLSLNIRYRSMKKESKCCETTGALPLFAIVLFGTAMMLQPGSTFVYLAGETALFAIGVFLLGINLSANRKHMYHTRTAIVTAYQTILLMGTFIVFGLAATEDVQLISSFPGIVFLCILPVIVIVQLSYLLFLEWRISGQAELQFAVQ